jgi:SAM-dependent methyltransferase
LGPALPLTAMSYSAKLEQEISNYRDVLDVSALPEIFFYWSDKHLRPKLESLGFSNPNQVYVSYISRVASSPPARVCHILSLGAGNCDTEVGLAELLIQSGVNNFVFNCLDVNPEMLARGRQLAIERNLVSHFAFIETDINSWAVEKTYDIIIANQSLHHFVELELLFEKTWHALTDEGFFLTNDMIGRNGHLRWPEALELVQACWSLLDEKHKWNHLLQRHEPVYENWDCSISGFEGIRAQDILPLLARTFRFSLFLGFGNLINVFIDRGFGHNFDPADPRDCHFIDFVSGLDDYFIESGKIKPTQMIAAMTKYASTETKIYKHLTPEFCVRDPNL